MCIPKSAQNNEVNPPAQPAPHSSKNRRYFRAKKVTWLQLLFAIEYAYCDPADRVTKRSVYRSP